MNAHALLTSQGWRGTGHSLHSTSDTIGLSKPLLVSRKVNNLGVGKKQHRTSDMWWMNAFDSSLKGLDTSKEGTVVQTMTSGGLDMVAKGGAKYVGKGGGLYASFVRGECLSGTITPEERGEEPVRKRKRVEEENVETKEERRAKKAAKRAVKAEATGAVKKPETEDSRDESVSKPEGKEERWARKAAKKSLKEQKTVHQSEAKLEESDTISETKEQRRERRRLKKLAMETVYKPGGEERVVALEKAKKKKRPKD